jgi:hypothetical protein
VSNRLGRRLATCWRLVGRHDSRLLKFTARSHTMSDRAFFYSDILVGRLSDCRLQKCSTGFRSNGFRWSVARRTLDNKSDGDCLGVEHQAEEGGDEGQGEDR